MWLLKGYPSLTASSLLFFWPPCGPQFNSLANCLCMQPTLVCPRWLVGSLVCFIVGGCFIHLSYGELMESEAIILGSYLTCILHTARISNVNVTLSAVKEWKMGNFKLSETNVKPFVPPAWDKEKIWVPKRIRTYDLQNTGWVLYPLELWISRVPAWCLGGHTFKSCQTLRFFLCPTLVTCWLINFHIRFTKLNIYHLSFFHQ